MEYVEMIIWCQGWRSQKLNAARSSEDRRHLQTASFTERDSSEETQGISARRRGPSLLWSGRDPVMPEYFLVGMHFWVRPRGINISFEGGDGGGRASCTFYASRRQCLSRISTPRISQT